MFGDHSHSDIGDIIFFVCQVTLQEHVFKSLNGFMVRSLPRYITIVPILIDIDHVCRVISQDYVIKWLYEFIVKSPSR